LERSCDSKLITIHSNMPPLNKAHTAIQLTVRCQQTAVQHASHLRKLDKRATI